MFTMLIRLDHPLSRIQYLKGEGLMIDQYITHSQDLANINKGFDDMKAGDCIRCEYSSLVRCSLATSPQGRRSHSPHRT